MKRSFIVGDEWLYFKLYCGPATSDEILTKIVNPLVNYLITKKQIKKWFFIRYSDPDNHLRLRFQISKDGNFANIISSLNDALKSYIESGQIWKVVVDTYNREVERYGTRTIKYAEELFFYDSSLTLNFISKLNNFNNERLYWGFGLLSIDRLLNDFSFSLKDKFELLIIMKENYASEFNMNKNLKMQLNKKYKLYSDFILQILNTQHITNSEFIFINHLINERSIQNQPTIKKIQSLKKNGGLEKSLNEYLYSYIHMINNRLFRSNQRLHELVLYSFLYLYYRSMLAQNGYKVNEMEDSIITKSK